MAVVFISKDLGSTSERRSIYRKTSDMSIEYKRRKVNDRRGFIPPYTHIDIELSPKYTDLALFIIFVLSFDSC